MCNSWIFWISLTSLRSSLPKNSLHYHGALNADSACKTNPSFLVAGQRQFHLGLWNLTIEHGFQPCLCRPYRTKTKKMSNASSSAYFLHPVGCANQIDWTGTGCETANVDVIKRPRDAANARCRQTNRVRLKVRWYEARRYMCRNRSHTWASVSRSPPVDMRQPQRFVVEQLQHPFSAVKICCQERSAMILQAERINSLCDGLGVVAVAQQCVALSQAAAHDEASFVDFLEQCLG